MDSFRFRPRLTGLEARENPASPAEVFAAMNQATAAHDFLMNYLKDINAPRDVYQVQYFKELMPTLARQSAQSAAVLGEFTQSVLATATANPALVPFILPVVNNALQDQATAAVTAGWMIKLGTDLGVPFPDGNIPPPPTPPTPPPPPTPADNGTVTPSITNTTPTSPTTPTTPTDNGTVTNTGGTVTDNTGSTPTSPPTVPPPPTPPADPTAGMSKTLPPLNDPNWRSVGTQGLRVWDEVVGSGAAVTAGATVTVHYIGWLTNGTQFDSSVDRGQPSQFSLNNVIQGWQQGIPGMQPGGVRYLYVPASLAYGNQQQGNIPPNSDLVFEVKLISSP